MRVLSTRMYYKKYNTYATCVCGHNCSSTFQLKNHDNTTYTITHTISQMECILNDEQNRF